MRIGIAINETWSFFNEIYADLSSYHQTSLFKERAVNYPIFAARLNRVIHQKDWQNFLRENDAVFFEWSSEMLAYATHQPKTCAFVTRLHRYEMYQWADGINWDAVDRIILVSHAKKREFLSRFPDQAHKIAVIPEAISPDQFPFLQKTFNGNIGILCNISPRKRVYELILTFYELCRYHDGFHLHIGGGKHPKFPDYYDAVHKLVNKLGLEKRIIFYDHVENPSEWYKNIEVFISNSYSEGLQVSPMEAMATGCLVLSHCWDGADELLPGEYIYYSDQELIEKILEIQNLSDNEIQTKASQLRAIVVDRFNVNLTKVDIRRLIEEAAGK